MVPARILCVLASFFYLIIFLLGLITSPLVLELDPSGALPAIGGVVFPQWDEGVGTLIFQTPYFLLALSLFCMALISIFRPMAALDLANSVIVAFLSGTLFLGTGSSAELWLSYGPGIIDSVSVASIVVGALLLGLLLLALTLFLLGFLIPRGRAVDS